MRLYLAILVGIIISFLLPGFNITTFPNYEILLYTLLAIGLYGGVYGIELEEFHLHRNIIFRAVTFGVLLKNLLIGIGLWLIMRSPVAFLFAAIVTQIDPLSVSYLVDKKSHEFSPAGRTILRAWSSFDDPMTVLLALYVFLPMSSGAVFSASSYLIQLGANLLFAGIVYFLTKLTKTQSTQLILLAIVVIAAIYFKLMLGIAIIGLFLRPQLHFLGHLIFGAFIGSAIILGTLIKFDYNSIMLGAILGILAFAAQAVATQVVAHSLHAKNKLFLSLAQHNGITSIILALLISTYIPQTIVVIAAAVIVINALYYLTNNGVEYLLHKNLKS